MLFNFYTFLNRIDILLRKEFTMDKKLFISILHYVSVMLLTLGVVFALVFLPDAFYTAPIPVAFAYFGILIVWLLIPELIEILDEEES